MTDPITTMTASMIATLAFQKFIEGSAGELAKKFTGEAIAKMGQLRELIWHNLRGNPDAENALVNVESGRKADLADIGTYLKAAMSRDPEFAGQVQAITQEINAGKLDQSLIAKDRSVNIRGSIENSYIITGDHNSL